MTLQLANVATETPRLPDGHSSLLAAAIDRAIKDLRILKRIGLRQARRALARSRFRSDRLCRLRWIDANLRSTARLSSGIPLRNAEVAKFFGVSGSTVSRDFHYLRHSLGAPTVYSEESYGWSYSDLSWEFPDLESSAVMATLVYARSEEGLSVEDLSTIVDTPDWIRGEQCSAWCSLIGADHAALMAKLEAEGLL